MQEPDCHSLYEEYCDTLKCDDMDFDAPEYKRCDAITLAWFDHCMTFGALDCKVKMPPKTIGGSTVDPDRDLVAKYFTRGDQNKILNPMNKEHFIKEIKAIDEAFNLYRSHDMSDEEFVLITSANLRQLANMAGAVFWRDSDNYKLTAKLCEMLYPLYMAIYEKHFREYVEKRVESLGSDAKAMYQSIVDDIHIFAEGKESLSTKLLTPLECGYKMAKAMAAKGIEGMFSFTATGEIFPLINLYFDAWQLAKVNSMEDSVFDELETGVCGQGTGIRAFIFSFAPQLAKALAKKTTTK